MNSEIKQKQTIPTELGKNLYNISCIRHENLSNLRHIYGENNIGLTKREMIYTCTLFLYDSNIF